MLVKHIPSYQIIVLSNTAMKYIYFVKNKNGLRKFRSCEEHIFTLTSIIRNRFQVNKDLFVAFIDMQKSFDCVNRDQLWYTLLSHNIYFYLFGVFTSLSTLYRSYHDG